MKIKREELFQFAKGLGAVKEVAQLKLAYAVIKNQQNITLELKKANVFLIPSEGIKKYENERIVLCEKYCKKDEKGKAIVENNIYIDLQGNSEFEKAVAVLQKKYKKSIAEQEDKKKKYHIFLQEEIDFEFYKIAVKYLPDNLTANQLEKIKLMIDKIEDLEKLIS